MGRVAGGGVGHSVEKEERCIFKQRVVGRTTRRLHAWRGRFLQWITEHIGTRTTPEVGQSEDVAELLCHSVLTAILFLRRSEGVGLAQ